MRLLAPLLVVALALCSCVSANRALLPEIGPIEQGAHDPAECTRMFPRVPWQYVHALSFRLADGGKGSALGVVALGQDGIRCALMTVEGLTLFEAHAAVDGNIEIIRALPPFDAQGFAPGLMRDLRTLFLVPPGSLRQGRLKDGQRVCRFASPQRNTDILPLADGCWRMRLYTDRVGSGSLEARGCHPLASVLVAETMELTVPGPVGYTLNLRLLSAEPLSPAR